MMLNCLYLHPTRAVIDKKLAILDKALGENPGCLALQLARLELYHDVWDEAKVVKSID